MRSLMLGLVVAVATLIPNLAAADDQEIARHIMSKLQVEQQRGALKGFHVDMRVDKGTVWYQGFVSNQAQKDLILSTAQKAKHLGVVQIVDDINIQAAQETQQVGFTEPAEMPAPQETVQQTAPQPPALPTSSRIQPTGTPTISSQPMAQPIAPGQPLPFAAAQAPVPQQMPQIQQTPQMQQMVPMQQGMPTQFAGAQTPVQNAGGQPMPITRSAAVAMPTAGDAAALPNYAWPSYAAHPNYAAVTYPGQYSASAWPYIGPFYPYPQVPLGWRKVSLEWDDGWWWLDFQNR